MHKFSIVAAFNKGQKDLFTQIALTGAATKENQLNRSKRQNGEPKQTCPMNKRNRPKRRSNEACPRFRQIYPAHKTEWRSLRCFKLLPTHGMLTWKRHPKRVPRYVPMPRMEIWHMKRTIRRKRSHNTDKLPRRVTKRQNTRRNHKREPIKLNFPMFQCLPKMTL